jgi:DNA helicase TIP49 (TBP-interacting protein)
LAVEEQTITQTTTQQREKHNLLEQFIVERQDPETGESNRDILNIKYENTNVYIDDDSPIDRLTDDETQKSLDDVGKYHFYCLILFKLFCVFKLLKQKKIFLPIILHF